MSYEIKPLRGKVGLSTDVDPLVFETGLQVSEMGLLHFIFTVDAVSAGINPGNPATFDCEHSWDGGVTWTDIPNMITEDVNQAGVYRAYVSNATGLIAPNVRVMLLCPAGEEVVIGRAERIHVSPRDSVFLAPPAIAGGIASEATLQDILSDTTALLALDYATETTLASVLLGIGLIAAKDFATETTLSAAKTVLDNIKSDTAGLTHTTAGTPLFWNFATGGQNLAAGAWKQVLASVPLAVRSVSFWNPTGEIIEIGIGAGGAEVSVEFIGPGDGIKAIPIPAGARVSLRCANNVASDTLVLGFLN